MVGVSGANTVYHMGTLSRASKQNTDKNQQVSQRISVLVSDCVPF